MYVCICNAVTEDAVHECLASGAQNTRQVKEGCGMKPGCGTCTRRIRAMVSEWKTASELMDAFTGGPATLQPVSAPEGDTEFPRAEPATGEPVRAPQQQPRRTRREVKQPAA
ncbi:(2Fe-2S)-binding protein [Actinocorallia aurantiaca]|jgi:bacterioferritin-associated ferredoxin|uniref:Bacterioferritin-associated ferredoxin n=1 Tax=Actinocorallia aurantiaca TaxID=46204 RepID=A0ABN3TU34_9ACTN